MAKIYGNTLTTPIKPNSSGGGNITVDQTYNPESENAQSGVAIHGLIGDLPTDTPNGEFTNLTNYISSIYNHLAHSKLTNPDKAEVGRILKIFDIDEDGYVQLEAVDMPSDGGGTVDQTYNPYSENAQSGVAMAGVIGNIETALDEIIALQDSYKTMGASE